MIISMGYRLCHELVYTNHQSNASKSRAETSVLHQSFLKFLVLKCVLLNKAYQIRARAVAVQHSWARTLNLHTQPTPWEWYLSGLPDQYCKTLC